MQAIGSLGCAGLMLMSAGCSLFDDEDKPRCGNWIVESGEECDEGPPTGIYGTCQEGCRNPSTKCGEITQSRGGGSVAVSLTPVGHLAFEAMGDHGLRITDMSDPMGPVVLGWMTTDGYTYYVRVDGDFAYLADGDNGLLIADVSDPRHPGIVGHYPTPFPLGNFAMDGSHLYMIGGEELIVLDVAQPSKPVKVGSLGVEPGYGGLWARGSVLLWASGLSGLWVFDVSNPARPELMARHTDDAWGDATPTGFIAGNEEWLAITFTERRPGYGDDDDDSGGTTIVESVRLVDIPMLPSVVERGRLEHPPDDERLNGITDMVVDGSTVYVEENLYAIEAFDLSDPASPRSLGRTRQSRGGLAGPGGLFQTPRGLEWVRPQLPSLLIVNLSDPAEIKVTQPHARTSPYAYSGFASSEGWLYTVNYEEMNRVEMKVAEYPGGPTLLGMDARHVDSAPLPGYAAWSRLRGPMIYVLHQEEGLLILDASDPKQPVEVGRLADIQPGAGQVEISGNLLLYSSGDRKARGIQVVDIADPAHPRPVSSIALPSDCHMCYATRFVVADEHVYALDYNRLFIYSLARPSDPELVRTAELEGTAEQVFPDGIGHLFIKFYEGTRLYSLDDPVHPEWMRNFDRYEMLPVYFRNGDIGYRAEENTLVIEDLSDPESPQLIRKVQVKGIEQINAMSRRMLFVLIKGDGLATITGLPGLCDP